MKALLDFIVDILKVPSVLVGIIALIAAAVIGDANLIGKY